MATGPFIMSRMHLNPARWPGWLLISACLWAAMSASPLAALDYVMIRLDGRQKELAGKIEVEAADGGVLFQTRDGVLWPVKTEELVSRRSDEKPFTPLSRDELSSQL